MAKPDDCDCVYCQWHHRSNGSSVQVHVDFNRWPDGLIDMSVDDIDAYMEILATTNTRSQHWN